MNTTTAANRKYAIANAIKSGKRIDHAMTPGELLGLAAFSDPLNYNRGRDMLCKQIGADDDELFDFEMDNELSDDALELARHSFMMDDTRNELNRIKYGNALIADDEILAFAYFLVTGSDIIETANNFCEVEYDDAANLVNHVANRLKFLLVCLREGRYDVLNMVIRFVRKNSDPDIDTLSIFPDVVSDDGGVVEYYQAMVDPRAYAVYREKERAKMLGDSEGFRATENATKTDEDEYADEDEDAEEDDCDNDSEDFEEPLVERDFEG